MVANNTAGDGTDFYGDADNPDDDLINNATGSNFVAGGGIITAPATLGLATSLANNGGNTQTLALLAGSAAIGSRRCDRGRQCRPDDRSARAAANHRRSRRHRRVSSAGGGI